MLLSNYTDLQAAVANHLHRNDLTAIIPDLIALAESRIARTVRVGAMENRATGTSSGQTISLPAGFLELRSLQITVGGDTKTLKYATPENIGSSEGEPQFYSIIGDNIYLSPYGSYSYVLNYYKKFDPLATTATNWLLSNAPEVYLYGTLVEAAPYVLDNELLATYSQLFTSSVIDLERSDRNRKYGPAMQVVTM